MKPTRRQLEQGVVRAALGRFHEWRMQIGASLAECEKYVGNKDDNILTPKSFTPAMAELVQACARLAACKGKRRGR